MALLRPIETIQSRLSEIPIKTGQIIFCTDTNDIYMDNSDNDRTHMTDIIRLKTEKDREDLFVPLIGKMYLVEETNILYKYNGTDWETISIDIAINTDSIAYNQLVPGTLQKKGQGYAPRTLGSVVYLEDGNTVNDAINELKNRTPILTTLRNTVKIITDVDTVSIGISGYNKDTDILFVYVNSTYLEQVQDYTIVDNNTIKNVGSTWNGAEEIQIFNFVVLKLTIPQTTFSVSEAKILAEEVDDITLSDNTTQTTTVSNYDDSTIELLLNKIASLESQMQVLSTSNTDVSLSYNTNLEERVYSTETNIDSLVQRVISLEESMNNIISENTLSRLEQVESSISNLENRMSSIELH